MIPKRLTHLALTASASLFLFSATAHADTVTVVGTVLSGPVGAIAGSTSSTAAATASTATVLNANFGLAGQGFTNGILNGVKGELESQTEVLNKLSDLAADNQYYLEKASKTEAIDRAVRIRKGLVDLCRSATAARRVVQGKKAAEETKAASSQTASTRAASTFHPHAVAGSNVATHAAKYCSAAEAAIGRCDTVSETPNADIKSATLMHGAQKVKDEVEIIKDKSGNILKVVSNPVPLEEGEALTKLTFNEEDIAASERVIINTVNPTPDRALSKDMDSSPGFLEHQAKFLARQTRISYSNRALNDLLADRTPSIELGDWKETINETDFNELEGTAVDGKISVADKLNFDVSRRFDSPNWYSHVAGLSAADKELESLSMAALELKLAHLQLQRLDDIKALLSVQLAQQMNPITKDDLSLATPVLK